jgi:uncharacterized membrane protein
VKDGHAVRMSKNRVEAFSDGVFAIVITLLVLELRPPEKQEGEHLAAALWDLWPNYIAYVIAFIVIGVMWINHHRLFNLVRIVDGGLLVLNLNLLLWTAVIPFPTVVMADYLRDGGADAKIAVAFFCAVVLVNSLSWGALYLWITHDDRLIGELPPRAVVRAARIRFTFGIIAYSIALGVATVAPYAALALHGAMALYYAFDQASVTRPPRRRSRSTGRRRRDAAVA